jgi:hypothetical protein
MHWPSTVHPCITSITTQSSIPTLKGDRDSEKASVKISSSWIWCQRNKSKAFSELIFFFLLFYLVLLILLLLFSYLYFYSLHFFPFSCTIIHCYLSPSSFLSKYQPAKPSPAPFSFLSSTIFSALYCHSLFLSPPSLPCLPLSLPTTPISSTLTTHLVVHCTNSIHYHLSYPSAIPGINNLPHNNWTIP